MPCSECERWAFHRIKTLGERNECPRCGATALATAARWSTPDGEPAWYYDLHGAVRELLNQDGDVPLLAARTLANAARAYSDTAELDFIAADGTPHEIDLIALVDDQLVVAEAKRNPAIGQGKLRKAIAKLVRVSDLLDADEILLCTTAAGPWDPLEVEALRKRIGAWHWRRQSEPRLRVITGLRSDQPSNELLELIQS